MDQRTGEFKSMPSTATRKTAAQPRPTKKPRTDQPATLRCLSSHGSPPQSGPGQRPEDARRWLASRTGRIHFGPEGVGSAIASHSRPQGGQKVVIDAGETN